MNILFVLYGDLTSNSAIPMALYAGEFAWRGHSCVVAIPSNLNSVSEHGSPAFQVVLYEDVLGHPDAVFPNGRPADVIHAWTPRENVRRFVMSYMVKRPTPWVIYLEDHELWISCRALGLDEKELFQQTQKSLYGRLPDKAHPFHYRSFIGLADAAVVIQDKLKVDVPPWVSCESVMPGVDLERFSPRPADSALRKLHGVAENERVIVYTGGANEFTKPGIEALCRAVGLINRQGYPCRLLRTGPFPLDFMDGLPKEARRAVVDLGVIPKADLPNLLALADVLVQPGNVDAFEDLRLPGKLPEFLAMGRPVVTPDVNIAHLLRCGVDAVLTRTGTADGIAEKCVALFADTRQADKIGLAGRRFAEKHFDIKLQAVRMERVYETVCSNFDPPTAAKVWQSPVANDSVELLLACKLRLLAGSQNSRSSLETSALLREHARLIEWTSSRVDGLEARINQQQSKIAAKTKPAIWIRLQQIRSFLKRAIQQEGGAGKAMLRAFEIVRIEGLAGVSRIAEIIISPGRLATVKGSEGHDRNDYTEWARRYDTVTDELRARMRGRIAGLTHKPLISVLMPTFNPSTEWLIEAVESVRSQIYSNWELCIADDASTDPSIRAILERYARDDPRIKLVLRPQNGHISAASNSALGLANGEWVALLDHDDLLSEHALFWVADAISTFPDARLIYSDEDKIDNKGLRHMPYFKCDWNPDLFYSHNLFSHLGVYHKALLDQIGGFREGFEGSQDYDLALRCCERVNVSQIHHIPRVLYHWRVHPQSTAADRGAKPYAMLAGERALNEHFSRTRIAGDVELLEYEYRARYDLPAQPPLVSLIVLAQNGVEPLRRCIDSIVGKTSYPHYEIIIVDNASDDPETLRSLERLAASSANIRVLRDQRLFNYSAINNAAVRQARGEVIGLISDCIEVITPEWLTEMMSQALRPEVGCVGAKLLYQNDTVQHAGMVLGIGGVAGHAHRYVSKHSPGYFGRASLTQACSAVSAACLLVRKEVYQQLDGLDEENLAVEFNDVDFCLRAREAGYWNIFTPYAELYQHGSSKPGAAASLEGLASAAGAVRYMKQRWGSKLLNDPCYSPNLTLDFEDFSLAWPPRLELL